MSKPSEMSNQDLETALEQTIERGIKLAREAERRTCEAAGAAPETYGEVNAAMSDTIGHLQLAKGAATRGGLAMPDVVLFAGGGK